MSELTQKMVDALKPPASGRITVRDTKVRGLNLRLSSTGSQSWSLEYRSPVTQKMSRVNLVVASLADARAAAIRHKAALGDGRDPLIESREALHARRIEHARSLSVTEALDAYERSFVTGDKAFSRRQRMARLRRGVAPFLNRAVASLAKGELITRLDQVQADSGPIARNRTQAEMRAWLGWLFARDHVPQVALAGLKKEINEQPRERTRVLSDAELRAILAATGDRSAFSAIVRVLLVTGMRRGEAANLQPRDLDFTAKQITVRGEVAKTNRERIVPMADAIAPMLQARCEGLPRDAYIFGDGSSFLRPFCGWDQATDRVRDETPEGDRWTLHDIRRTVATRLHDAGVDTLVVEDLLGHINIRRGVAGIYNRSVTLAKQAQALQAWAARLAELGAPNVVMLRAV